MKSILTVIIVLGLFSSPVFAKHEKGKSLPRGLQKKLELGGTLPPGWERKLARGETLEEPVYRQSEIVIPVDSEGVLRVRVEDKLIRLIETAREIIDIVDLIDR